MVLLDHRVLVQLFQVLIQPVEVEVDLHHIPKQMEDLVLAALIVILLLVE